MIQLIKKQTPVYPGLNFLNQELSWYPSVYAVSGAHLALY